MVEAVASSVHCNGQISNLSTPNLMHSKMFMRLNRNILVNYTIFTTFRILRNEIWEWRPQKHTLCTQNNHLLNLFSKNTMKLNACEESATTRIHSVNFQCEKHLISFTLSTFFRNTPIIIIIIITIIIISEDSKCLNRHLNNKFIWSYRLSIMSHRRQFSKFELRTRNQFFIFHCQQNSFHLLFCKFCFCNLSINAFVQHEFLFEWKDPFWWKCLNAQHSTENERSPKAKFEMC